MLGMCVCGMVIYTWCVACVCVWDGDIHLVRVEILLRSW